jgi:hypothetical protein
MDEEDEKECSSDGEFLPAVLPVARKVRLTRPPVSKKPFGSFVTYAQRKWR